MMLYARLRPADASIAGRLGASDGSLPQATSMSDFGRRLGAVEPVAAEPTRLVFEAAVGEEDDAGEMNQASLRRCGRYTTRRPNPSPMQITNGPRAH
jgi:hypothetical protein